MIEYIPGNLWGTVLPAINNNELLKCSIETERFLIDNVLVDTPKGDYGSTTTAAFNQYNLFTIPSKPFQELYYELVKVIKPCLPDEEHMIQCWLNVFRSGQNIEWHKHWDPHYRVVHGFYCVNVTPSYTEYKYEDRPEKIYRIESKEGLLVFGKSNNDLHRSSQWHATHAPRVTIAFDIVPVTSLGEYIKPNHFIPF